MEAQDNNRDEETGSSTSLTGNEATPQPNPGMNLKKLIIFSPQGKGLYLIKEFVLSCCPLCSCFFNLNAVLNIFFFSLFSSGFGLIKTK